MLVSFREGSVRQLVEDQFSKKLWSFNKNNFRTGVLTVENQGCRFVPKKHVWKRGKPQMVQKRRI